MFNQSAGATQPHQDDPDGGAQAPPSSQPSVASVVVTVQRLAQPSHGLPAQLPAARLQRQLQQRNAWAPLARPGSRQGRPCAPCGQVADEVGGAQDEGQAGEGQAPPAMLLQLPLGLLSALLVCTTFRQPPSAPPASTSCQQLLPAAPASSSCQQPAGGKQCACCPARRDPLPTCAAAAVTRAARCAQRCAHCQLLRPVSDRALPMCGICH